MFINGYFCARYGDIAVLDSSWTVLSLASYSCTIMSMSPTTLCMYGIRMNKISSCHLAVTCHPYCILSLTEAQKSTYTYNSSYRFAKLAPMS